MTSRLTKFAAALLLAGAATPALAQSNPETGYAAVNGLEMYYEIHGSGGTPLVVLHGAYMSTDSMGPFVEEMATDRQVVAVDFQAHGRTADIDRPITYDDMASDTVALLGELGLEEVDLFGYSMGGTVALRVAMDHPDLVRKLVVASASYTSAGARPGLWAMIETITPETFAGTPFEAEYRRVAANPDDFPVLVEKLVALDRRILDWTPEDVQGIAAPTLLIVGDSDILELEHVAEFFTHLGGNVAGDMAGLPEDQLLVLPGTTHVGVLFEKADLVVQFTRPFLDAPIPN